MAQFSKVQEGDVAITNYEKSESISITCQRSDGSDEEMWLSYEEFNDIVELVHRIEKM